MYKGVLGGFSCRYNFLTEDLYCDLLFLSALAFLNIISVTNK